jgi:heterodisulfide reductase subunit A
MNCERGKVDEPVAICSLKRFIADYEFRLRREKTIPVEKTKKAKVAIIGSGPAGLSCAYDLVKRGYPVTVFDAAPQSGGLLRYGIPEYRLPKSVLDNEIGYIQEFGVEIKTNTRVDDVSILFEQEYKAVFLATGNWASQKLGVPNEGAEGVIYALDFLRRTNSGEKISLGEKIAVIGGGSVAIDSARTSVRLGAKEVHIICLECRNLNSKDRMLAQDKEIEEAEEEGVIIHPCLGVRAILSKNGKVIGLETITCTSVRDEDGTFTPRFQEDAIQTIEADNVIIAIGQAIDKKMLPKGLEYTDRKTVSVDPITLQTDMEGIFAGGDVVSGPTDVIRAITAGKEAAISIDRYLGGMDLKEERQITLEKVQWVPKKGVIAKPRNTMPVLDLAHRRGFEEVELGFNEKQAIEEASRCLSCGKCFKACPYGAPQFGAEENAKMQMCNLCSDLDRWKNKKKPICVSACPLRALDAGPIDELILKYSDAKKAFGFSYSTECRPSVIFRLKDPTEN